MPFSRFESQRIGETRDRRVNEIVPEIPNWLCKLRSGPYPAFPPMLLCSSLRSLRVHSAPLSRTLFSLPNLPSFSPFGSSEQTFKQEKKFRYADHTMLCYSPNPTQLNLSSYTDRELYAVVADVASYPKFIPFCVGSRISPLALQQAMQQKTTVEAELTVGFMQFKESYVSNVTCVPFESVQVNLNPTASTCNILF